MPEILITVRNKIPVLSGDIRSIVTENKDYTVRFSFDEEWGQGEKLVYFVRSSGYLYPPMQTVNNCAEVPEQHDAGLRARLLVGVQQGDIRTSTACEIPILASVVESIDEEAIKPPESFWEEIEEIVKTAVLSAESAKESEESARENAGKAANSAGEAALSAESAGKSAVSASASASSAAVSADRAEQVAVANGYVEFELDNKDGILYLVRTDNIVDEIDFELDENTGELEVIIE